MVSARNRMAYRSQTAHCALWPLVGRVGLGSSENQEDRPSPLSHNEGLITGPASLKSHSSRLPVYVLRSPNILIALLFSPRFYCASLLDSLGSSRLSHFPHKSEMLIACYGNIGPVISQAEGLAGLCAFSPCLYEGAGASARGVNTGNCSVNSVFCHSHAL